LISWGSIFYTYALLMEPVERELGLDRVQMSLAFSLALLVEGLLAYTVGRWIDRGHERCVMVGGSLLAALCLGLHRVVESAAGFYALWMGLGAAMACVLYSPVFAVVTRRFPADFRRAIITLTFLGGLASTVFIPVGDWLIARVGWRDALTWLAALHLLVCAPLHLVLLRDAPVRITGASHSDGHKQPQSDGVHALLRSPGFLMIGAFMVLMTAATASLPAHMISLLREHGLPQAWVIAVPALIGAFQVLGRLVLFVFERHFDVHKANRMIPALIPVGLLALLVSPWLGAAHQGVVVLFVVLFGMGNGMLTIVKGTAMAQYVSQQHVAALNGALGLPLALARSAAPLALGWAWSVYGSYAAGLAVVVALTTAGVLALSWAQRHTLRR
jgi:sugar phosphate permease